MPKPAEHIFEFYEGDSEEIVLRLKDAAGVPLDLSNASFRFQAKSNKYQNDFLQKTGVVTENYIVTFSFEAIDYIELQILKEKEMFDYDIEMITENGSKIRTILNGNLFIYKGVSL